MAAGRRAEIAGLVRAILAELGTALGRPELVADACTRLDFLLRRPPGKVEGAALRLLAPLLRRRDGDLVRPIAQLFEAAAISAAEPGPFLVALLRARDARVVSRGVELGARLAAEGRLRGDTHLVPTLAEAAESESSPLGKRESLAGLGAILRGTAPSGREPGEDPAPGALLDPRETVRRLSARVLDAEGADVAPAAARLLGDEAFRFLAPHLAFTRATHVDLVALTPSGEDAVPALPSLRRAQEVLGEAALGRVLAELGWSRVNLGLEATPHVALTAEGSFPLLVSRAEAALLEEGEDVRRVGAPILVVARGGRAQADGGSPEDRRRVARFRDYSLRHADVLQDFLDFRPLTTERVATLLRRMDRIVADHVELFRPHAEECAILGDVYARLRERIVARLEGTPSGPIPDPEVTRLVQSFEDAPRLADVRTLHGLKRHLHQRSLRLASRLLAGRSPTDRTVDLLVVEEGRLTARGPTIRWADLDPPPGGEGTALPAAVTLLVEGFTRQLLHGHREFPASRVFLYGTEAHYYLTYFGHPAFVRVDWSPPLRGGLVDLEYYGVSKSDLEQHPDPELEAVGRFLRGMEFDVEIEATRVHARYDKERALDAGDVASKAASLFRLAPYLMDLDWILGSLRLDADARRQAIETWERSFARRGVIPVRRLLTADRTGILLGTEDGPSGRREEVWTGAGPCPDRFPDVPSPTLVRKWESRLRALGLETAALPGGPLRSLGQLDVERAVLNPLREAVARGELRGTGCRLERCPRDVYRAVVEAELFAEMLGSTAATSTGLRCGRLAAALEKSLRFKTTGRVQGRDVQRARLPLPGATWGVFVLRDDEGLARLAFFAQDPIVCRRRDSPDRPWSTNVVGTAAAAAAALRRAGLLDGSGPEEESTTVSEVERVRASLRAERIATGLEPPRGARIVEARRVAPGRASGRVGFGGRERDVGRAAGRVLVLPRLEPEDYPRLQRAAAVVCTGGSVLSHAALVANQMGKPALVTSGTWVTGSDGHPALRFPVVDHREEAFVAHGLLVTVRRDLAEREQLLREGDLVVVDADAARLEILGQESAALGVDEDLRRLAEESSALKAARDPRDILVRRGQCLRTIRRLLAGLITLEDPLLACHVVHEVVRGPLAGRGAASCEARAELLRVLLANARVGPVARERLGQTVSDLVQRERGARERALRLLPDSESIAEVVALRLDVIRAGETARGAIRALEEAEVPHCGKTVPHAADVDRRARWRLYRLRSRIARDVAAGAARRDPLLRHRVLALERLDALLPVSRPRRRATLACRESIARGDASRLAALAERLVIGPADGGAELAPLIGPKAANLAEIERILQPAPVAPWFAVTDLAFRKMLATPVGRAARGQGGPAPSLAEAIVDALARTDRERAARSAAVRRLFEESPLPEDVARAIERAYAELAATPGVARAPEEADTLGESYVAVRSSGREEDRERESRAGEFDTFLWVRGVDEIRRHVRLAWAGLWTERAIQRREALGLDPVEVGGGVLVQRIVKARVSGVVQTRNVVGGETREMLVEAGLGLGEGVVSGLVGTDEIRVVHDRPGRPPRFRYVTREKAEQVVFDRTCGVGTVRVPTKYHQRLRPALEYVELDELVRAAWALEQTWGWPLDLEFGFEEDRLFILQARPLPVFSAALVETLERHPLEAGSEPRDTFEEGEP